MTPARVRIAGAVLLSAAVCLAQPAAAEPTSPVSSGETFTKGPPIAVGPEVAADPADGPPLSEAQQAALAEMEDIREIRPPVAYGWDPRWGVGAAAVALLAAVVGLLWRLRRRGRESVAAVPEAPVPPPEEVARQELAALAREAGLGDKEFYFRLCTAVRRFLDGRYGADTLERTTEELLPVLRTLPLDEDALGALVALFRHADPIRYADGRAPGERRRGDLTAAQALVRSPSAEAGEGG